MGGLLSRAPAGGGGDSGEWEEGGVHGVCREEKRVGREYRKAGEDLRVGIWAGWREDTGNVDEMQPQVKGGRRVCEEQS